MRYTDILTEAYSEGEKHALVGKLLATGALAALGFKAPKAAGQWISKASQYGMKGLMKAQKASWNTPWLRPYIRKGTKTLGKALVFTKKHPFIGSAMLYTAGKGVLGTAKGVARHFLG